MRLTHQMVSVHYRRRNLFKEYVMLMSGTMGLNSKHDFESPTKLNAVKLMIKETALILSLRVATLQKNQCIL